MFYQVMILNTIIIHIQNANLKKLDFFYVSDPVHFFLILEIFTFFINLFFNSALIFFGAILMIEPPEEADNTGIDLLKTI